MDFEIILNYVRTFFIELFENIKIFALLKDVKWKSYSFQSN